MITETKGIDLNKDPNPNNLSPVIGILGKPTQGNQGVSWFESFYVKWLESGGGRVVPIRHNISTTELTKLLENELNGFLFTGGGLELNLDSEYVQTANKIFSYSTKSSRYFPIHGTCMGFQLLNILAANNHSVLTTNAFDSEDISYPLIYTKDGMKSRMISNLPNDIQLILGKENVTVNFHHDGVTPNTFFGNQKLSHFYHLISTNFDRNGKPFCSAMESKDYPIYGTQFHPERQQFEFNSEDKGLVHTLDSIRANQAISAFFVNECRKNDNIFTDQSKLIYNYTPVYSGNSIETYYF